MEDNNQEVKLAEEGQGGVIVPPVVAEKKSFGKRYAFPMILFGLCIIMAVFLLVSNNKDETKLADEGAATDFTYQDIDGNSVTMSDTNGKVRLVYFFYSNCPDVCPPTTFMMSQVQEMLKADGDFGTKAEFLSITIDPVRDTPEALRVFGDKFGADYTGWKFLRGDEAETAKLAEKYQLGVIKDNDGNFGHSNLIVVVDKKGRIRDFISPQANGSPSDMSAEELYKEMKSLM
ncbi:SCO family protein [Cohnella fermenti]|uniref:SCO family protein n=1 Tax=Cohnella fermenti TaxID=2565925 RepID=A0A4S4C4A4_9BACL|nr:SCO family protein [Cohnella fermenti]THF82624.1 SCO family protein [Cohnella fermenti]